MDRRRSVRFQTHFDALISSTGEEGAGVLTEISYSGAKIEQASTKPAEGTKLVLYVFVQPVAPFEIHGHVARVTEKGFAVMYELFDPEIRRLVDDVSAIVSGPAK